MLGRKASDAELESWLADIDNGDDLNNVAREFLRSPEYRIDYVGREYAGMLGRTIITPDVSRNYSVLTRPGPATDEVNYWVYAKFALGKMNDLFAESDEFANFGI